MSNCRCGSCLACARRTRGTRGPTGPTGPAGSSTSGRTWLKFTGTFPSTLLIAQNPIFLADPGGATVTPAGTNPLFYPVPDDVLVRTLAVNLKSLGPGPQSALTVDLMRNNVVVPGFSVVYGGGGPATGIQIVTPAPAMFLQGDRLDLRVSVAGAMDVQVLSAILSLS